MSRKNDELDTRLNIQEMQKEDAIREHERARQLAVDANKAAIDSGVVAIRTVILINGGASVAMLGFIGGMVGQGRVSMSQLNVLASTLVWFAAGVAVGTMALGFVYLTNYAVSCHAMSLEHKWAHPYVRDGVLSRKWKKVSVFLRICAIVEAAAALGLFVI